jgi:hypothetical protein
MRTFFAKTLPERRTDQFSLDELTSLTSALEADRRTPFQLPKLDQVERSLEAAGVGKLVAEIRLRKPETRLWLDISQYAWLASALEGVNDRGDECQSGRRTVDSSRFLDSRDGIGTTGECLRSWGILLTVLEELRNAIQ